MQRNAGPARKVLVVTAVEGSASLAVSLSEGANVVVEVVRSRRAALAVLRRERPAVVLMDTLLPEGEMTTSEMVWQNAAGAVPLDVNVRAMGSAGLVRLLRNLLDSWENIALTLRHDVEQSYTEQLRSTVTGMLLQSDMALRDSALAPTVEEKVRAVRALADTLRSRLLPA